MTSSVVIGGVPIPLRKLSDSFSVLNAAPQDIQALRDLPDVIGVSRVSREAWVARVSSSSRLDSTMDLVRASNVAHHSYVIDDDEFPGPFVPTDRVNVGFREGVAPSARRALQIAYNLEPLYVYTALMQSYRVTSETGANPIKLCERLRDEPSVEFAEPDFLISKRRFSPLGAVVADFLPEQWHLHETPGAVDVLLGSHISADGAWAVTRGDGSIVVAVLDDGFDLTNPDIGAGIVGASDFTDVTAAGDIPIDFDPSADSNAGDYHGTPCAGLAIARHTSAVSGVAPGCGFMPVRVSMGMASQDYTLQAIRFISERADVLSCSWGAQPTAWSQPSDAARSVIAEVTTSGGRRKKGLVVCFAAGNDNLPTFRPANENPDGLEYYDIRTGQVLGHFFKHKDIHGGWTELPGVVVVGSTTSKKRKALYSNWGPQLTIVAPSDNFHPRGVATRSQYPNATLITTNNKNAGRSLKSMGLATEELGFVTRGMGGTSGATPLVAGTCGLILSANPNLSADEVVTILKETGSRDLDFTLDETNMFNNRNQDGSFAAGTGHSIWFGYGRVDAARAVDLAGQ